MVRPKFETDKYYHIYNRGVDKRDIFLENKDFIRFLLSIRLFNQTNIIGSIHLLKESNSLAKELDSLKLQLVSIICYCLNTNHYHFFVKQLTTNGISKFMHKLSLGYTNYFNSKYKRSGSLFQGKFKAVEAKSEHYLWYVSAYINGNAEIHKITKANKYQWSSYLDYLNLRKGTLCTKEIILKGFKGVDDYKQYVDLVIRESAERKEEIKKLFLE